MTITNRVQQPWGVLEVTVQCTCGRVSIYGLRPESQDCRCSNPLCSVVFPVADLRGQ